MLLTFLRNQGASLAHVRPEHLMEPKDYRVWIRMERRGDVATSSPNPHHRRRSVAGVGLLGSEGIAMATLTPVWSSARHNRRAQLPPARRATDDMQLMAGVGAGVALAHTPSTLGAGVVAGVGFGGENESGAGAGVGETDSSYALPSADDAGSSGGAPHATASSVLAELGTSTSRSSGLVDLKHQFFESISKQAWIDVLLQLLKARLASASLLLAFLLFSFLISHSTHSTRSCRVV